MRLPRSTSLISVATLAVLVAAAASPNLLRNHVGSALHALAGANTHWLWVAGLAFLASFACTVGAWRAALGAQGGRISAKQVAARLGLGSLVNAFAPAKLGDAVKIALCARTIDAPGRIWTAGGVYAALAAARALALAGLVVAASAAGALPLWPVFALCGLVVALGVAAASSGRWRRHARIARLLDGFAALERSPRAVCTVLAWTFGMAAARLAATVAVALAFGLPHPLLAALVILPALDLAGVVPLTPGSVGIGSGAVAVALAARGIGASDALGAGMAIQAVETLVSIAVGGTGALYLARPGAEARRWLLRFATVGAAASAAALLGVVVLNLT